jgi:hypothetical protein
MSFSINPPGSPGPPLKPSKTLIRRPCQACGIPTTGVRCSLCQGKAEAARQARQPYRAAYESPEYRKSRIAARRRSGGRCEAVDAAGARCPSPATEAHHTVPLSTARSLDEAIALCRPELLRDVCHRHNPRGPGRPA